MELPRAALRTGLWLFLAYGFAAEVLPFLIMVAHLDTDAIARVMRGPWPAVASCTAMLMLAIVRPAWLGEVEPRLIAVSAVLAALMAVVIAGMNYFTRDVGAFDFFAFFFCLIYLTERARQL